MLMGGTELRAGVPPAALADAVRGRNVGLPPSPGSDAVASVQAVVAPLPSDEPPPDADGTQDKGKYATAGAGASRSFLVRKSPANDGGEAAGAAWW